MSKINKKTKWEISIYELLKPKKILHSKNKQTEQLDLIIVPGIAFDKTKGRLGRGGGYYDQFLSTTKAKKIALAFEKQIVNLVPKEAHDINMDIIITESRIIK